MDLMGDQDWMEERIARKRRTKAVFTIIRPTFIEEQKERLLHLIMDTNDDGDSRRS